MSTISELVDLGHPDGAIAYAIYRDNEIYIESLDEYAIPSDENMPFRIVQVNDYNEDVREAIQDSYSSVTINVVIEYKGEFFKSEAEMGSYTDSWDRWRPVNKTIKMVEVYE